MMPPVPADTLVVLQVTLTFWKTDPEVELVLMRGALATDDGERIWCIPASLVVPTDLTPDTERTLELPLQVTEGLRASLADLPEAVPLWVRFAKPHGYLGALPWECALTKAIIRPVLRLPDLLERPRESRDVLEVAVCFDAAPEPSQERAGEQIKQLTDMILRASPRSQTRVNLFTTADWLGRLRATKRLDRRVQIHDTAKALTSREIIKRRTSSEQQESPWSTWIIQSLGARSLDAIHFICRSDATECGPALVVSSSPSPNEKLGALSYVSAEDVAILMMRTGAWAALFSPPPDGTSGATLALMADALANTRPVSVIYQPALTPEHMVTMEAAYEFLFSPGPLAAPSLSDGFLYCPPTSVAAHAGLEIPPVLKATDQSTSVLEKPSSLWDRALAWVGQTFERTQPPNWLTAVQRHVETVALEELRRRSPDVLLSRDCVRAQIDPTETRGKSEDVEKTMEDILRVVSGYLKVKGDN
jgi:hypothetical protein